MLARKEEQAELLDAVQSSKSEFVAVYGRRRIGKTFLVEETFAGSFAFEHTGLAKAPLAVQLRKFRSSLRTFGLRDCPALGDWYSAFEELQRLLEGRPAGRKIVFIDEMPWLDTPRSNFVSALENFWNGWAARRKDVLLVVCGSATSWIVGKIIRDKGGLHNRVTRQIPLKPFTLGDCERFADAQGLALSRHEIVRLYMVLGGVPWYWSLLRPGRSAAQEVDRLFFSENAILAGEFRSLFDSLFRAGSPHVRIVEALASRRSGLSRAEIAQAAGLADNGALTRLLEELQECGFVRAYRPFGAKKKGSVHQLVDCFSLFHRRFVASGAKGSDAENYWSATQESGDRRAWEGLAFELVCLLHVRQIRRALGIEGVLSSVCSWRAPAAAKHGAQVDLVLDRADGVIDLCEMKWSEKPHAIDKAEDADLRRRRAVFLEETGTRKSVQTVLVSPEGVEHGRYASAVQAVVTLADLFA